MSAPVLKLFFSYSHVDEPYRVELEKHLSTLRRQGVISGWHDRKLLPGDNWRGKIDEEVNRADIFLALVSADFLDSEYCYDVEMSRALERHKVGNTLVVPVILRSADWQGTPLGSLQALPAD